jgi:hypothetical protein
MKHWKDQKSKEDDERKNKFEQEKIKANHMRMINDAIDRLKLEQQKRAIEVLRELSVRGVKQIGKDKIQHLERQEGELEYESIMAFYANILKRDREAFELNKTKKVNDVEIWTRAVKEEEKATMEKYCAEHGQEDIEQIQKAIADRHAKELATKTNLKSAQSAFTHKMKDMMIERASDLVTTRANFATKLAVELKETILKNALNDHKRV